jgi:hypothetical protein
MCHGHSGEHQAGSAASDGRVRALLRPNCASPLSTATSPQLLHGLGRFRPPGSYMPNLEREPLALRPTEPNPQRGSQLAPAPPKSSCERQAQNGRRVDNRAPLPRFAARKPQQTTPQACPRYHSPKALSTLRKRLWNRRGAPCRNRDLADATALFAPIARTGACWSQCTQPRAGNDIRRRPRTSRGLTT